MTQLDQVLAAPRRADTIERALLVGGGSGVVVGGITGTFHLPVIGTFLAADAGLALGCAIGAITGIALSEAARHRRSVLASRLLTAVLAVACSVLLLLAAQGDSLLRPALVQILVCVIAGLLGGVYGPSITFGCAAQGVRPAFLRWALRCTVAGALIGGVVGLVIGLHEFGPATPLAVLEGGLLGASAGAVLGTAVAAAVIARRAAQHRTDPPDSSSRPQPDRYYRPPS